MNLWPLLLTFPLIFSSAYAGQAAQVKMLKGQVHVIENTQTKTLNQDDWVNENAEVQTEDKSFVKLEMLDKSQITVGPKSKMIITKGKGTQGLINLIGGQLRAQIEKGVGPGGLPKLIIKTKNSAMGVRGTHFEASFNQANGLTNLVTMEGEVSSIQIRPGQSSFITHINSALMKPDVTSVHSGQYTAVTDRGQAPMEPVRLNPGQIQSMSASDNFLPNESGQNKHHFQSPIPPGVPSEILSNHNSSVDQALAQTMGNEGINIARERLTATKDHYVPSTESSLREGGYYDPRIGYIMPPSNALIDPNTGLAIPPADSGGLDTNGSYLPPQGLSITEDGKFVADTAATNANQTHGATVDSEAVALVPLTVTSTEQGLDIINNEVNFDFTAYGMSADEDINSLVDDVVNNNLQAISDASNANAGDVTSTNVNFDVSITR